MTAQYPGAVAAETAARIAGDNAEAAARAAADALLAPLASPALTGNPTAPTQTAGNNSTRLATTAYADGAVASEAATRLAADSAIGHRLMGMLDEAVQDCSFLVISDSTANEVGEWPDLVLRGLAALYPAVTFKYTIWVDGGTSWPATTTVQTGSGSTTCTLYNMSIVSTYTTYCMAPNFDAMVTAVQPDLIFLSHGKNHKSGTITQAFIDNLRDEITMLSQVLTRACPAAELVLVAEIGNVAGVASSVHMYLFPRIMRLLAAERGYGFVNAYKACNAASPGGVLCAEPTTGALVINDGVHPNAAGSQVWANEVLRLMTNAHLYAPRSQQPSSLLAPADNLLTNGDWRDFTGSTPAGWTNTNTTCSKNTTYYESTDNGYALRVQSASASAATLDQTISSAAFAKAKAAGMVTVAARVRVPSGQATSVGRVRVQTVGGTSAGSSTSASIDEAYDGFKWIIATRKVAPDATSVKVTVYADSGSTGTADCTFDRVILVPGPLPGDTLNYSRAATSTLDTDGTLAAASDARVPSQKAVKTYVDASAGVGRSTFSNANYTVLTTDRFVAQTGTLSAPRTVTMPAASSVAAGTSIVIADESGTVTSTNTITISRAGSDTIDGATSEVIGAAYAQRRLFSDGTSKWSFDKGVLRESNNLSELTATAGTARANIGAGPLLTQTAVKTSNYTAAANEIVRCDASGGGFTVTLPAAPAQGTTVVVFNTSSPGTVTVARGGSDYFTLSGVTASQSVASYNAVMFVYQASTAIWAVLQMPANYVTTTDSRLSDARTPTSHASTHAVGGSDLLKPYDQGEFFAIRRAAYMESMPSLVASASVSVSSSGAGYGALMWERNGPRTYTKVRICTGSALTSITKVVVGVFDSSGNRLNCTGEVQATVSATNTQYDLSLQASVTTANDTAYYGGIEFVGSTFSFAGISGRTASMYNVSGLRTTTITRTASSGAYVSGNAVALSSAGGSSAIPYVALLES